MFIYIFRRASLYECGSRASEHVRSDMLVPGTAFISREAAIKHAEVAVAADLDEDIKSALILLQDTLSSRGSPAGTAPGEPSVDELRDLADLIESRQDLGALDWEELHPDNDGKGNSVRLWSAINPNNDEEEFGITQVVLHNEA